MCLYESHLNNPYVSYKFEIQNLRTKNDGRIKLKVETTKNTKTDETTQYMMTSLVSI